jgi:hypothetical protein
MRVFVRVVFLCNLILVSNTLNAFSLTAEGVSLGRVDVAELAVPFQIDINLGDDKPVETFVVARFQNNSPKQRGADGFWIPWDGGYTTLLNNGVANLETGELTISITNELLSEQFLPIFFTVGYRTEANTKFGYLVVDE